MTAKKTAAGKRDLAAELGKFGARDPEAARLMGMIVALAGEVFVLKAQVERLQRALQAGGAVDAKRLAAAAADEGMAKWLAAEETAFTRSLTAPYLEPDLSVNATRWMREK
ncbi:MAG TPA: hypothetical protein VMU46_15655 [Burkholderiales bacterium]|nr:hypothetical protein [Burkholderiales bacterium]